MIFLSRRYLRKINDDRLSVVVDHYVELVVVAVDDAVVCELQQEVHQFVVQNADIVNLKIKKKTFPLM
jgi:hypothetical protein